MQHARFHGQVRRAHKLNANKWEMHFIEVKYCEDIRPLTNSTKVYASACKLKKLHFTLHTILLGLGGSIYTSNNTLHHLKELRLDSQRAHKTALKLHAHSVHYAHKLTTRRTLKKRIALKVSVWSRGLPAPLQIPTSYYPH